MTVTVLHRPLYSIGEAARFLYLSSSTLRRWLEGTTVDQRFYPPVIREEPTGADSVTWGEFVEAGFLREYRGAGVPLQNMRPFIQAARVQYGVPYPLAHFRPLIENRRLVYDLQREVDLDEHLYLVRVGARGNQLQLAPPVEAFLKVVDFAPGGDVAVLRPLGKRSPIALDPEVSFGLPQIRGVRAERIAEAVAAGDPEAEVASDWDLTEAQVGAALDWQQSIAA
jgi:uncharacterized protein (DUF433 family)